MLQPDSFRADAPIYMVLVVSVLMSASALTNPTTPKALSFDASAYITVSNHIRVAVSKTADVPVIVLLRNAENQVIFRMNWK